MKINKPGITILFASVSLGILIMIQVYIIFQHYKMKEHYFDVLYHNLVVDVLNSESAFDLTALDSAYFEFDEVALHNFPAFDRQLSTAAAESSGKQLKEVFLSVLKKYDTKKEGIKEELKKAGMDTTFVIHYTINALELIDFDRKIPVYESPDTGLMYAGTGLYLRSYSTEQNHFSASYDLYIDFTRKTQVILAEMKGLMIIVLATLVIVLYAFISTLRSLWKQKKLNTLKSDFIDNISHEFKTPLTSISLAATSIKHPGFTGDREKVTGLANTILSQNKTLNQMIDQVIDVSLIENGKINLKREEVDILDYLEQLKSQLLREHSDKNIELHTSWDISDDLKLFIDKLQIERVIRNLFSNAVKYSNGSICIDVCAKEKTENLSISVKDKGIGMNDDQLKHIFDRFYRAENGRNRAKGLGLGLYIVKSIVEAHNGAINISSRPGKGTCVSFSIPKNSH
jgi:signal transduction histidine kinase